MKKAWFYLLLCVVLGVSCSTEDNSTENSTVEKENGYKVFGGVFSPNQDWSSTTRASVTIMADADLDDIAKVQILTCSPFGNADANGATALNEVAVKKGQAANLVFDVPAHATRLYAACVSKDGRYRIKGFKVGQESVTFESQTQETRATVLGQTLADAPVIGRDEPSYNSRRAQMAGVSDDAHTYHQWYNSGWDNDHLYKLADKDEDPQIVWVSDYSDDEKEDLLDIIQTYLPNTVWKNGKRYNDNLETVMNSDLFKYGNNYLTTTGDEPITLSPIYRKGGTEPTMCHVYYYYFKPEQIAGMSEEELVQFFKDLPKYKAIQVYRATRVKDGVERLPEGVVKRMTAFTLLYYGDEKPVTGKTTGSYVFPADYQIGIMLRSIQNNNESDANSYKNGCLYADGRLNTEINQLEGHFANAKLEPTAPRVAVLGANGKNYLCFESGADMDFNDLIIEMNGGIKAIGETPTFDSQVYTFCFEDREVGDYDLNDVVIKAQRVDRTHVKYSVEAVGSDEVYLCNTNGVLLNDAMELHTLFEVHVGTSVNVSEGSTRLKPAQELIEVPADFNFTETKNQLYVYNKTTGKTIKLATKREYPHGLMIPGDFAYPSEGICIKDAYSYFTIWGKNPSECTDWYLHPVEGKVYTQSVFE